MKVDMRPEAVTKRLQLVSELYDLCIALGADRLRKRMQRDIFQPSRPVDKTAHEPRLN